MSAPLSPGELRIEISKCLSNAGFDFLKRLADGRSLAEQYLNGDGHIHVHFSSGVARWCADYICCGTRDIIARNINSPFNVYESIVLVEVVKASQVCEPVPTIIRLKSLDNCYMGLTDPFEISVTPSFKSLSLSFDRELRARWLAVCVEERESVDKIIKSASQIVANLSNQNCHPRGHANDCGLSNARPYEKVVGRIGVVVGNEGISVFIGEGSELPVKIEKVFLCPTYTQESAVKAVTGRGSLHG